MTDTTAEEVKRRLPQELRLLIYSFISFVDFEPFRELEQERDWIRQHTLPPRKACLQEPAYVEFRQKQCHRQPGAMWPDDVEEAFFKGNDALFSSGYDIAVTHKVLPSF